MFESLPPGADSFYESTGALLQELAAELYTISDGQGAELVLVDYLEVRLHLNTFRSEYGIWWGFDASTREEIKGLVHEFEDAPDFTPDQIERLIHHWNARRPNWRLFLGDVSSDDLGLYQVGLPVVPSPTSMEAAMQLWMRQCAGDKDPLMDDLSLVSERLSELFRSFKV